METSSGDGRRLYLEAAAKAADLVLLELDFERGCREGIVILGEALGAEGLAIYEARELGAAFRPIRAWPEERFGDWSGLEGAGAAELAGLLAERAFIEARVEGLFPAGAKGRRLIVPLRAAGALAGFIAAALPAAPSAARDEGAEGVLASFALSLSAAWAKGEAEKAAAKALAEEAAARRAGALLLARAGHELRTPLVALDGIAALLEERGETMDPGRRREAIRLVRQGGKRLLRLVEEMLALTRIEAGLRRPEPRELDFGRVAADSETLMAGLLAGKEVAFAATVAADLPAPFVSDERAIEEILENLLGNAAKFTARGTIELRIEPEGAGAVSFSVRDEGAGMDEASIPDLAEPFHATRPGLAGERGSGLGLSVAANLARLLGGRVVLESERGKGTTARLVVPPLSGTEGAAPG